MKWTKIILLLVLSVGLMGNRGCETTNTVVVPEGPKAAELSAAKDRQIAGLVEQVKAEQEARELAQYQASLAAANLDGVLFAAEHIPVGLPRNAIEEEAKLGKARLPAPDPQEVIKSKDRVIAILQNEVEKAKALYGKAFDEAAQAKVQIAAKDEEIAKRGEAIKARAAEIAQLEIDKKAEQEKHANDIKDLITNHQAEIKRLKDEQASKERRWFVNAARIAGLGLIVAGAIALAVFKLAGVGGGLVGAGVLVGLISIGVEMLTAQWWFPYLCGLVFVAVIGLGCYGLYRLWVKHQLNDKKTQAIQDAIDEATLKGDTKMVEELKAHLRYRLGAKDSFFGRAQAKEVAALGLVDPKGEEDLKAMAGGASS